MAADWLIKNIAATGQALNKIFWVNYDSSYLLASSKKDFIFVEASFDQIKFALKKLF